MDALKQANDLIAKVDMPNVPNFSQLQQAPISTQNEFFSNMYNVWRLETIDALEFENQYINVFRRETWPWGDGVGFVNIDITTPETWVKPTPDTKKTYKVNPLDVSFIYTTLKDYYQQDLAVEIIQGALINASTFNDFVSTYRKKLYDSISVRLWKYHGQLISTTPNTIQVVTATDMDNSNKFIKKIEKVSLAMTRPTTTFNAIGYTTATPVRKQILIINTSNWADIKVDTIATLFHSDKINPSGSFKEIILDDNLDPDIYFQIETDLAYAEIPRFQIPFTFYPQEAKGLIQQTFYNYWSRAGRNRGGNSVQVRKDNTIALSSIITTPNLQAIGFQGTAPTAFELDTSIKMLFPRYITGNITYSDINATSAKAVGKNIYNGTVNLTYTKAVK